MILAAHTARRGSPKALLVDLAAALQPHLPRGRRRPEDDATSVGDAVVRALCHDLSGSVAYLESALGRLDGDHDEGQSHELLELARAHAAHVASVLRTAEATGGSSPRRAARLLRDVVAASAAASGLPADQLTLRLLPPAGEVAVGDARLQRILVNLLENAHRHGGDRPVRLTARSRPGWVEIVLRQSGISADRIAGHLSTTRPPADLTGLGLWSVQRQAHELGGRVLWHDDGAALTLSVELPDR